MELTRKSLLKLPDFHGSAVRREPAKNQMSATTFFYLAESLNCCGQH